MASTAPVNTGNQSTYTPGVNYKPALALLSSLFFMWGFITCLNDILIPHLKALFDMNYTMTMLIQFTFFGAYFLVSLPAGKIVEKIGYKNGIILGLSITGVGALMFFPASELISYGVFLSGFFVLASGITILQVSANPYVSILGSPETAAGRLNMTQALNSLGTTVAPVFGGMMILADNVESNAEKAQLVQGPYIGIALTLFVIAAIFFFAKLPKIVSTPDKEAAGHSILRHRHLVLGAIAIFVYVGAEVSIGSFMINFFGEPNIAGLAESEAAHLVALYWGGAMIGRFLGAISLSDIQESKRNMMIAGVTVFAYFLAWYLAKDATLAAMYMIFVVLNIVAFKIGKNSPSRTLAVFAVSVVLLVSLTVFFNGKLAMWTLIAVGLFNSIMFPTIFTLGIDGLGDETSRGSGVLVMAIVGGAIIPLIMGALADTIGIHLAFLITLICYAYIAYYGLVGYKRVH